MPRQPRLDARCLWQAHGALHHVIGPDESGFPPCSNSSIDGITIFRNRKDREDFLDRLADLCRADALSVYAWALMGNHLLLRTGNQSLSKSMRKLLTGYVVNDNRRHTRYGHLFQNRYKSILCEDDPYLVELTRSIHLNPLRAGIVKSVKELRGYQWCGHSAIMGRVKRQWQDTDTVLAYFGKSKKRAIEKYEDFVQQGIVAGSRPELVGGGLIRSIGGWSQVLSLRRVGSKVFSDERILGSSEFVNNVIADAEQKAKETLRLTVKIADLPSLARTVCEGQGVDEAGLRSGSRKREVVKSRRIFCQIAVRKMGYSGAEVARFLGINTSAVNRLAVSDELPDVEKYA